jgi:F0F1-type ATP synthase beta subunit
LAARRAGRGTAPPEALSLVAAEPGLAAGLQAMFVSPADGLADPSPAAVAAYLEGVSAEARLFEELLEDG